MLLAAANSEITEVVTLLNSKDGFHIDRVTLTRNVNKVDILSPLSKFIAMELFNASLKSL